jgi:phosphoglycolate phosphatase
MNVLIDLDGTLSDPAVGMVACVKHALAKLARAAPGDDQLKKFIGPPLEETFGQLLRTDDKTQIAGAVRLYRERYSTEGLYQNTVYPGIPAALKALREGGATLYLATSKPQIFAERILVHFGLAGYFRGVYGSGLDGARSNKGELIAHLLKKESISSSAACMVGDRSHDVVGAKANGVRAIGALWGFGSKDELLSAGAAALCEVPAQLPETILA